jgi:gamma-glutamyltranspeptidase / glutathione hydrolase
VSFTTRPELVGTFGMVSSTHWLASATGMSILEAGGNAFDAAVAAGFVLQVVEPHLNGPGGEVPIVLYSERDDEVAVVAGQGTAPAGATIEHYHSLGLDLVPGTGLLAACVPGAFGAWTLLLERYGTMTLREVMSHAIGYASDGYPAVAAICSTIAGVADLLSSEWPDSAALYLHNGEAPHPGSRMRNRVLARTYERIVDEAERSGSDREAQIEVARAMFYEGFVAEAIDRYCRGSEVMDSSGKRHSGVLRGGDLSAWRARVEPPVTFSFGDLTICKTGPWGQGPVFLQQLALLSGFDLGSLEHNGPDYIHTLVECAKLAFADREAWYGDPAFVEVPIGDLLSPGYNDERRALVGPDASHDLRPGAPSGSPPRLPTSLEGRPGPVAGGGEPTMTVGRDTCHVDVVDRFGNLVAATPSGGWLQSSPVIPELGFPLGTRAQMFWLEEGLPNSLAPNKRPRTTLSPSLVLEEGRPYLAFGTPGGDQQDQWTLAFFLAHTLFALNLQEAIDAPAFHTDHFPSSFFPRESHPGRIHLEGRVGPATIEELRRRGHEVVVSGPWSLGRLCAVSRTEDGWLKAGANARGMQGYAVGR